MPRFVFALSEEVAVKTSNGKHVCAKIRVILAGQTLLTDGGAPNVRNYSIFVGIPLDCDRGYGRGVIVWVVCFQPLRANSAE